MKKAIAVLGATGSIGRQTLEVADRLPDQLHISALAAGKNWQALAEAALRYRPGIVAVADEAGVTKATIYRHPDLRARIEHLRVQ